MLLSLYKDYQFILKKINELYKNISQDLYSLDLAYIETNDKQLKLIKDKQLKLIKDKQWKLIKDKQWKLIKDNNLCIINTFIYFYSIHIRSKIYNLKKIISNNDIDYKSSELKNKKSNILESNDIIYEIIDQVKIREDIRAGEIDNEIECIELMDRIMSCIDKDIIMIHVYNVVKPLINAFKEYNSNIINSLYKYKDERKLYRMLSYMNTYVDKIIKIYLENIRNKLCIAIFLHLDKLKELKKIEILVDAILILKFNNKEINITRKFSFYIILNNNI